MSRSKTGFFVAVPPHTGSDATSHRLCAPAGFDISSSRSVGASPRGAHSAQLAQGLAGHPDHAVAAERGSIPHLRSAVGHQQLGLALGLIKDVNEPLSIEALQKQLSDKPRPRPRRPADRRGAIASESRHDCREVVAIRTLEPDRFASDHDASRA